MKVDPFPAPWAVDADGAAVKFDQLLHDGKPEAQAAMPAGRGGIRLAEAVKDVGQEFGLDAFAGVGDADFQVGIDPLAAAPGPARPGRELDGVGEQIPEDLLEAIGIAA